MAKCPSSSKLTKTQMQMFQIAFTFNGKGTSSVFYTITINCLGNIDVPRVPP